MSADNTTRAIDVRPATDDGRRVDEWALEQQADALAVTMEDAYGTVDTLTVKAGRADAECSDYEEAYWALKRAQRLVEVLAHMDGVERLDLGAVTFGEATEEEMARFERGRDK